jgi:hypothetical protein
VAERAGAVVVVGVGVGAAAAAEVEGVAVAATAAAEEEEEEAEEGAEAEAEAGAAEEVVVVVGARLASAASGLDYAHHITSRHVTHTTNQRVFTTALRWDESRPEWWWDGRGGEGDVHYRQHNV